MLRKAKITPPKTGTLLICWFQKKLAMKKCRPFWFYTGIFFLKLQCIYHCPISTHLKVVPLLIKKKIDFLKIQDKKFQAFFFKIVFLIEFSSINFVHREQKKAFKMYGVKIKMLFLSWFDLSWFDFCMILLHLNRWIRFPRKKTNLKRFSL